MSTVKRYEEDSWKNGGGMLEVDPRSARFSNTNGLWVEAEDYARLATAARAFAEKVEGDTKHGEIDWPPTRYASELAALRAELGDTE